MSDTADKPSDAMQRLSHGDSTLKWINLSNYSLTDAELNGLIDCLLTHPDIVDSVGLGRNQLTDETGVKLARYVATSTSIQLLNLGYNRFGEATYLAVAAALHTNTSLQCLYLINNQPADKSRIDSAFADALRLNPNRPAHSTWMLYSFGFSDVDCKRLRVIAEQLGHPSLQMVLAAALLC